VFEQIPIPERIQTLLGAAGIELAESREIDVAERFDDPRELWVYAGWQREPALPAWTVCEQAYTQLFHDHGGSVELRQRRYLWTAVLE